MAKLTLSEILDIMLALKEELIVIPNDYEIRISDEKREYSFIIQNDRFQTYSSRKIRNHKEFTNYFLRENGYKFYDIVSIDIEDLTELLKSAF